MAPPFFLLSAGPILEKRDDSLTALLADILPLLFAALAAAFPLALGWPVPWWVLAGFLSYAGFAALAAWGWAEGR